MFRIGNVLRITKYLLLSAWTLSSDCLAAVDRVQSWGDDDQVYFFTTRRPYIWKWFTDLPTYKPPHDSFEIEGRTIFFVVLFISISIISFIIYLCRRHWNEERQFIPRISGATVHPPPRHLDPSVFSATTTHAYSSGNSRPLLAFANVGYQNYSSNVDGRTVADAPPDYSTVAIADLTAAPKYNFPVVMPCESPPPKYRDGYQFP